MKSWKNRLATILAAVVVFFGVGVSATVASAESVAVEPSTSIETEIAPETDEKTDADNLPTEDEEVAEKSDSEAEISQSDWEWVVECVKNAVDAKKMEILIAGNIGEGLLILCYMFGKLAYAWYKKRKDTSAEDVKKTKKAVGEQTKAVNELIGHTEGVKEAVAVASEREKQLATAGLEQNEALRCLFRGVQLKQSIKDEAMRHLNKSDECYDNAKK
jgi:hypothetical protein